MSVGGSKMGNGCPPFLFSPAQQTRRPHVVQLSAAGQKNENPESKIVFVDNPGNVGVIITAYQINFTVYQ